MQNKRLVKLLKLRLERPSDPFILFAIAQEHERDGDLEKALEVYQQLEQEKSDYTGTYYHLGGLLEKLNRTEDAITVYEKGIEICRKAGDKHAAGELNQALMMAQGEL